MAVKKPLVAGTNVYAEQLSGSDTLDAKLEVSATDRVLGRDTSGAGAHEQLTIHQVLRMLPEYVDDAAAITGGLSSGDFYRVAAGNDAYPKGLIKQIE